MEVRSHFLGVREPSSHRGKGRGVKARRERMPHVKRKTTNPDEEGHVGKGDLTHGVKG